MYSIIPSTKLYPFQLLLRREVVGWQYMVLMVDLRRTPELPKISFNIKILKKMF